ncbi:uncharacterized protein F4807DRAFT_334659 [Annulohypoxylon truncatum]|uniref:uncharacterized protein n=1 Tax=Annulohypoxylon truncatum TaxID=327061 RepID=UPI0020082726|nr:uncharacterized protein F4807DRAFT_334659 [Annulohypoxylon truncatum]KAI1204355.1 hypothetical protein F4807DRAFT_334659 [Annulohypoxylon truncatum]
MNSASSTGYDFSSPTSTESGTVIPTPSTSRASSTSRSSSTNIPSGPLNLTMLSTTSWRQPYPSVGQFAMTDSEEVVAAGPNGLFYFRRIHDHAATPWSEPRPFPSMRVTLNQSTVSGLALYPAHDSKQRSRLHLYCVSGGDLHSFYLTDKNTSFLADTSPPLAGSRVTGKPTVVQSKNVRNSERWSLVVPCQSGGLLHTSATYSTSYDNSMSTVWGAVDHLATDLGIISAVSVTAVHSLVDRSINFKTELVAACISRGQLNVVQGSFGLNEDLGRWGGYDSDWKWEGKTSTRILHPGEVTGNPVLITGLNYDTSETQLDLLVPSAEGGIFHFFRMQSAPNDWHMIGRVAFPQNIPPASCLSFHSRSEISSKGELYALVQIGGRLYHVKTTNDKLPWYNACLNPIVHPGPFFE